MGLENDDKSLCGMDFSSEQNSIEEQIYSHVRQYFHQCISKDQLKFNFFVN